MLPVVLPHVEDYSPATFADDDETSVPVPPLARATDWVEVTLDLGEGPKVYRRETNTMPQWAGSCWYELRYLDPTNEQALVDPEIERYWMGPRFEGDSGGVDLYVGGAEHAVLHLLYARFWHKVLFDLGHVSSFEPYRRLFNQGMIQAAAYTDDRGLYVEAAEVDERDGGFWHGDQPVRREFGKMGKSLRTRSPPTTCIESYGADTLRLYEMFTGPLDQSRPWDTKAVVGVFRLLQRIWRNVVDEDTGDITVTDDAPDDATLRALHRTIDAVRDGMENMRFNISIARITELNNHLTVRYPDGGVPRSVVEPLVLLLAPLAPHISEELWSRLGHPDSLADEPFPEADQALLVDETVEITVGLNGKVRARIQVPADADAEAHRGRGPGQRTGGGAARRCRRAPRHRRTGPPGQLRPGTRDRARRPVGPSSACARPPWKADDLMRRAADRSALSLTSAVCSSISPSGGYAFSTKLRRASARRGTPPTGRPTRTGSSLRADDTPEQLTPLGRRRSVPSEARRPWRRRTRHCPCLVARRAHASLRRLSAT